MRVVALLLVGSLAACSGGSGRGPAWPSRQDPETDGGESLAPRTASVIAAADKDEEKTDEAKPVETKAADAKPAETKTDAKPAATTTVTPEEVINVDDIIIEIED